MIAGPNHALSASPHASVWIGIHRGSNRPLATCATPPAGTAGSLRATCGGSDRGCRQAAAGSRQAADATPRWCTSNNRQWTRSRSASHQVGRCSRPRSVLDRNAAAIAGPQARPRHPNPRRHDAAVRRSRRSGPVPLPARPPTRPRTARWKRRRPRRSEPHHPEPEPLSRNRPIGVHDVVRQRRKRLDRYARGCGNQHAVRERHSKQISKRPAMSAAGLTEPEGRTRCGTETGAGAVTRPAASRATAAGELERHEDEVAYLVARNS